MSLDTKVHSSKAQNFGIKRILDQFQEDSEKLGFVIATSEPLSNY